MQVSHIARALRNDKDNGGAYHLRTRHSVDGLITDQLLATAYHEEDFRTWHAKAPEHLYVWDSICECEYDFARADGFRLTNASRADD